MTDPVREESAGRSRGRMATLGLVAGLGLGTFATAAAVAQAACARHPERWFVGHGIGGDVRVQHDHGQPHVDPDPLVASGNRYEIATATMNGVAPACRLPARVTVVTNASPYGAVGNGGTAPADGAVTLTLANNNTVTWTSGAGPLLDNIPNADSTVKLLVVIRG